MPATATKRSGTGWPKGCMALLTIPTVIFVVSALVNAATAYRTTDETLIVRATTATLDARESAPHDLLEVVVCPGHPAAISIIVANSVGGAWAAYPLELTVTDPTSGKALQALDLSRPVSWGASMFYKSDEAAADSIIDADLALPEGTVPGPYAGLLEGTLRLPVNAQDLHTVEVPLSVPFSIRVVSVADIAAPARAEAALLVRVFLATAAGMVVLQVILRIAAAAYHRRH